MPIAHYWPEFGAHHFAVGHSSECFSFIKDWVEKKVRRQLAHAQKRKGFGWERWSRPWLYDTLAGCGKSRDFGKTVMKRARNGTSV